MQALRSVLDRARDTWAPVTHSSTFRQSGQITPEEFILAGDYLVYKFPSWAWSSASSSAKAVSYLPPSKQYLVTRGVPCRRRLDENFAGEKGLEDAVVRDGFEGEGEGDGDGWLRTGGGESAKVGDVRTLADSRGDVEEADMEEDEIPDMEDDDDDEEAIIRDPKAQNGNAPLRTYTIYIAYTPYYRTPRLYLSGYSAPSVPLPPKLMLEDIVGDYKDKTVTLEDFPFFDSSVKMASVHPCKHASVMKVLLDRADAAMKIRKTRLRKGKADGGVERGMEGLVEDARRLSVKDGGFEKGVAAAGGAQGDEWEVLEQGGDDDDEVAIRVDQYVVVFLKFMASVTPGIEHDQTMGI